MNFDENPYADEKLYTADEIYQIILGLLNVYWSKSWLGRIFYKPWFDALTTLAIIIRGEELLEEAEFDDLIQGVEKHLGDNL